MNYTPEFINGVSGVYAIIHRETGCVYVGSTVNLAVRRQAHVNTARRGGMQRVHVALRECGHAQFDFEVLDRCDRSVLLEREQFYIRLLGATQAAGLNVRDDARAVYGLSPSAATRARQRLAKVGKPLTEEHKENLRNAPRRSKKALSPEHRAKLSAAHKTSPKCKAWLDKLHASRVGTKETPEQTAKRIAPLVGRKRPEWVCEKIKAANAKHIGKRKSPEVRERMKAGWVQWRIRNNKPPLKTK